MFSVQVKMTSAGEIRSRKGLSSYWSQFFKFKIRELSTSENIFIDLFYLRQSSFHTKCNVLDCFSKFSAF